MTQEQDKKLAEIGRQIADLFPDMYGKVYFQFNLKPGREDVNMNYGVEMSKILNLTDRRQQCLLQKNG